MKTWYITCLYFLIIKSTLPIRLVIIFSHLFTSYLLGPVTEVKTDIYVTSFGPVSDVEMVGIWEIKCTFWGWKKHAEKRAISIYFVIDHTELESQRTA